MPDIDLTDIVGELIVSYPQYNIVLSEVSNTITVTADPYVPINTAYLVQRGADIQPGAVFITYTGPKPEYYPYPQMNAKGETIYNVNDLDMEDVNQCLP